MIVLLYFYISLHFSHVYPIFHSDFADDIFKCMFVHVKYSNLIPVWLKFVSKSQINHKAAVFGMMAWNQDKSLPKLVMVLFNYKYMHHSALLC